MSQHLFRHGEFEILAGWEHRPWSPGQTGHFFLTVEEYCSECGGAGGDCPACAGDGVYSRFENLDLPRPEMTLDEVFEVLVLLGVVAPSGLREALETDRRTNSSRRVPYHDGKRF